MKTLAAGAKAISQSKGARSGPSSKRITRGKGPTAANPQAHLEGMEKAAGLKGPYHG